MQLMFPGQTKINSIGDLRCEAMQKSQGGRSREFQSYMSSLLCSFLAPAMMYLFLSHKVTSPFATLPLYITSPSFPQLLLHRARQTSSVFIFHGEKQLLRDVVGGPVGLQRSRPAAWGEKEEEEQQRRRGVDERRGEDKGGGFRRAQEGQGRIKHRVPVDQRQVP